MATNLFIIREQSVDRINYLPNAFCVEGYLYCPHTKKELRKVIETLARMFEFTLHEPSIADALNVLVMALSWKNYTYKMACSFLYSFLRLSFCIGSDCVYVDVYNGRLYSSLKDIKA